MSTIPELYLSTDIETDGPCPGINSMLSFGTAVYTKDKELIATFSANLETLPDASANPITTAWWETQPEAWEACRQNLEKPEVVMPRYVEWVKSLGGKPVFVAYPFGFDFTFMYYYMHRFAGESPFKCAGLDIRSYAMAVVKQEFRSTHKDTTPKEWREPNLPHNHIALDDAIEQGAWFCNMLKMNK